ncbi:hypothetical protein SLA2020_078030 [Shorea laevis]
MARPAKTGSSLRVVEDLKLWKATASRIDFPGNSQHQRRIVKANIMKTPNADKCITLMGGSQFSIVFSISLVVGQPESRSRAFNKSKQTL